MQKMERACEGWPIPRLPEGWKQFQADNIDVTPISSLPQYGVQEDGLKDRLTALEDQLKRTLYELELTRSQLKDSERRSQELAEHLGRAQRELGQRTADLEHAGIQIDQLSRSVAASTPPNISSKLHLQNGDYFFPYNPDLRQKATEAKVIGSGASGTVWQMRMRDEEKVSYDNPINLTFARKVLRAIGGIGGEDVENEIRVLKKLCSCDQDNFLVQVFHIESISGGHHLYQIDMELCVQNLDDKIKSETTTIDRLLSQLQELPFDVNRHDVAFQRMLSHLGDKAVEILKILVQVAQGVEFIHSQGEVHRDLKPENILFSYIHQRWKIADFGFTTEGSSNQLRPSETSRGTPVYRAPELLKESGGFHAKSDVWAFGCIAYELYTGKKAFSLDYDVRDYYKTFTHSPKTLNYGTLILPSRYTELVRGIVDLTLDKTIVPSWEGRISATDLWKQLEIYLQRLEFQLFWMDNFT